MEKGKITRVHNNGKMVQIGRDWLFSGVDGEFQETVKALKPAQAVEYTFKKEHASLYLTAITVEGATTKVEKKEPVKTEKKETKKTEEKVTKEAPVAKRTLENSASSFLPDESWTARKQLSIENQSIGKMTSQTLVALQGFVTNENVLELIQEIYKKYEGLIR